MGWLRTRRERNSGVVAQAACPHRDGRGRTSPGGSVLRVGEFPEGGVAQRRQQAQGASSREEQETEADQGQDRGEPLILLARRGLVHLLRGQDAAGQRDHGSGGEGTSEDSAAAEGAPVGVGEAHGGFRQVDGEHRAQPGDGGPCGGSDIGGAIGVNDGHGHHGGAHETSDR